MSYAIVRNEKLTRAEINGKGTHNDRKAKNHTNKDIDPTKTYLNYYIKKNELTYTKEFDKYLKENNVQCHLRSNSIIMCQMVFTSDQAFFDRIGEKETKRYFDECYKFICDYKNLGEKNIISAVVHLDEGAPHMHLMFVPVVHTKDKEGKEIDKICARDFWKGRDSYRKLQDTYFNHVKSKGFDLERGMFVEDTERKHYTVEEYKKITNYENTKKILNEIKLELPEVPNINDISKFSLKRDERILEEIIKPKDELIKELYKDNLSIHKELSKQSQVVDEAEKYQKERDKIIADNEELHNTVKNLEREYKLKSNNLDFDFRNKKRELEEEFEEKTYNLEYEYKGKYHKLEKENSHLHKIIDKFYFAIDKFIEWICDKFSLGDSKELVKTFEKDTNISLDPKQQIKKEEIEKEWDLEL
ncbi:MAG: plasmid recombination protein [Clostridia bacterium]|nr:plasmid recombination protein [Clostridia bacterium]